MVPSLANPNCTSIRIMCMGYDKIGSNFPLNFFNNAQICLHLPIVDLTGGCLGHILHTMCRNIHAVAPGLQQDWTTA